MVPAAQLRHAVPGPALTNRAANKQRPKLCHKNAGYLVAVAIFPPGPPLLISMRRFIGVGRFLGLRKALEESSERTPGSPHINAQCDSQPAVRHTSATTVKLLKVCSPGVTVTPSWTTSGMCRYQHPVCLEVQVSPGGQWSDAMIPGKSIANGFTKRTWGGRRIPWPIGRPFKQSLLRAQWNSNRCNRSTARKKIGPVNCPSDRPFMT